MTDRRRALLPRGVPDVRAIVPKGAQGVRSKVKAEKEKSLVLKSTQRAMQLRNGKGGSFGTGELVLSKMSGREKLELLAGKALPPKIECDHDT